MKSKLQQLDVSSFNKYEKKFFEVIRSISKKDKIAIFHDVDGDGISAAAITTIALKRLGFKVFLNIGVGREEIVPSENTIRELKNNKIDLLITLDKPTDKSPEVIKEIAKFSKVLVIDHHSKESILDLDENRVLIFKPQFFSNHPPEYYATAKIAFDYFSKIVDLKDVDWIACAGTMSDAGENYWKDFVRFIQEKYSFFGENPWKTDLPKIISYIDQPECYKTGYYKKSLNALIKAKGPNDFLKSDLKKYYEAVSGEIKELAEESKTKAKVTEDLVFYIIKPKYKIKSILSTILSIYYYPDKTVVLLIDDGTDTLPISFRRNDMKKDMVRLAKESLKGLIDRVPGGHFPAAGGFVWRSKLEEFKKRVIEVNSKL